MVIPPPLPEPQAAPHWRHTVAHSLRRVPWVMSAAVALFQRTQPHMSLGVVGVVFDDQARVLVVEHVLHPRVPWGLPGGWAGRVEQPAATLVRELREELGLAVQVLAPAHLERGPANHLNVAYVCRAEGPVQHLSAELLGYRWAHANGLPPLTIFHQHAVQHAQTLYAHLTLRDAPL